MEITFRHTLGQDAVVVCHPDRSDICPRGIEIVNVAVARYVRPGDEAVLATVKPDADGTLHIEPADEDVVIRPVQG